jgi:hypothetical protein
MLQVALSAFGGGLSAWSQRIVVEQRRWMTNEQFLTGLTVARLFPGPNQINMAVYIGAEFQGLPGALAALAGMLLVPFSLLMALGVVYFQVHELPAVDRLLAGVVVAAAGMALSMGFKILDQYRKNPLALALAPPVRRPLRPGRGRTRAQFDDCGFARSGRSLARRPGLGPLECLRGGTGHPPALHPGDGAGLYELETAGPVAPSDGV